MSAPQWAGAGTPGAPVQPNLTDAGQRIDAELRRKPSKIMALSPEAGAALADAHADFLADLGQEAIRLARKDRLRTVDREHVDQALSRLGAGSRESKAGNACSTWAACSRVRELPVVMLSPSRRTLTLLARS